MKKELESIDMAIEELRKQKQELVKKAEKEKESKKKAAATKISAKDKKLIESLSKRAQKWYEPGLWVNTVVKVKVKANIRWDSDRTPDIDNYSMLYGGKEFDFDDVIRGDLFERELEKAQKDIDEICRLADELQKRYPDADIHSRIFV